MRRILAFVLLATALLPAASSAQSAAELEGVFRRVSTQWARGDASGITGMIVAGGVSIDVADGPMGPLGQRQASAVLRRLFDESETIGVRFRMLQQVGGEPPRAFGAITWTMLPRGTRVPVHRTVYFGLEYGARGWQVTEIRLIP